MRFSQRIILGSIVVVIFIYAGGLLTEHLISNELIEQIWRFRLFTLIPVGAVWWLAKEDKYPRALQPAIAACCILLAGIHDYVALVVNHFFACIWYMLGDADENNDWECQNGERSCSWMQVRGIDRGDGNWYLYVTCLYWAMTTVKGGVFF